MNVLLISSDDDETAFLKLAVQRAGLVVLTDARFDHALEKWFERPADLVILVAEADALGSLKLLRRVTSAPIAILLDDVDERAEISLYNEGADLVMTRPYSIIRFLARLRALLRRSGTVPVISLPVFKVSGLTLDPARRSVKVDENAERRLTQLEFRLLYTLMTHRGQTLPPDTIVERVWGYAGDGNRDLVRGLINRLRRKIEPATGEMRFVITDPGVGYHFADTEVE